MFLNVLKSKTIVFGLLIAILSWAQNFILNLEGLSADQVTMFGTIIGAMIVWLRSVTSESLAKKTESKDE